MKKVVCLVLTLTLMLACMPNFAVSVQAESEIYQAFSDYLVFSGTVDDGYTGVSVGINTYLKGTSDKNTPVAVYITNHAMPRIGTEDDVSIVTDLLEKGYIVCVLDYQNDPRAVSPDIDWGIQTIVASINESGKYLNGQPHALGYTYPIPSGCRIERDILYFELDKHAPNGTINYIIDVWNEYYAGQKTDNNGNLLPTAETITDCIKKDGTPIDLDLKLDIIYPSKPKEVVPVYMLASSSETRPASACRADRPVFTGFVMNGYAGVIYDHEYIPMSRNDHYGYLDKAFSLYKYTANRSHSAAVRRVRQLANEYGYSADYMGTWGFSKSSTGPAILSDTTHLEKGEPELFGEEYTQGLDPTQSPQPQPWLTYEDGTEISSNVTVTYSGSGPGFHNFFNFTAPQSRETAVPILNSCGTEDTTGGFYTLWPPVYRGLQARDLESLCMDVPGLGHTYPCGYDEKRGMDLYKAYFDFFDNHIRAAYREEPPVVLWLTPLDKTSFATPFVPIEVKFSRAMDFDSVKAGVKVINEATGAEVAGEWTAYNGNTKFQFISYSMDIGTKYRIEVTNTCKGEDGVAVIETMTKRFQTEGNETVTVSKDAYVDSRHPDENFGSAAFADVSYEDGMQKAYLGFHRDGGFSDVSKATLVLKGSVDNYKNKIYGLTAADWDETAITWNNAPANNTDAPGFLSNAVYGGKELAAFPADPVGNQIDVTEYVKSLSGEDATFALSSDIQQKDTLHYDFEDMDTFEQNTHYRWGGGTGTANIVSTDANTGQKCLEFGGRKYNYTRMKLVNCFKETPLTSEDVGNVYRVSMYVKPVQDCILNLGVYSPTGEKYGTQARESENFSIYAGRWNKVEYEFTVDEEMLAENTQFVGIQTSTVVPTLYVDDILVTLLSSPNQIVSKEGATALYPAARLLLDTAGNSESVSGDAVTVVSGKDADKNFADEINLYVKGADAAYSAGAQKGYVLVPLDNVDTAAQVNLKFTTASPAKQVLSVYGVDAGDLNAAPSSATDKNFYGPDLWDNTISWNVAVANDINGSGVLTDFVYGGAPLAQVDTSEAGEKSIDVTEYVKMLKDAGAQNATFIFVAQNQNIQKAIDFESDIAKYDLTLSHPNVSSIEVVEGGYGDTGHALHFKRSGTDSTGFFEAITVKNFLDPDNTWSEEDIGKTITVSMWAKGLNEISGTNKNTIVAAIAASGSGTRQNLLGVNGISGTSEIEQMGGALGTYKKQTKIDNNVWTEITTTFTITKELLDQTQNLQRACLVLSAFYTTADVWYDEITCEVSGEPVEILTGQDTVKEYTFEEADFDLSQMQLSDASHSSVEILENAGEDGSKALHFYKDSVTTDDYNPYNPAVSIPFLINGENRLTAADVGKTYQVTFQYRPVSDSGSNCTVLYKMGGLGGANGTGSSLDDATAFVQKGGLTSGSWNDGTLTFTITEDMVANKATRTALVIGSYVLTNEIYVDNIKSVLVSDAVRPHLAVSGSETTQNQALAMHAVRADAPNSYFNESPFVVKSADYIDSAVNAKKAYASFAVEKDPFLIKSAELNLNVLFDGADSEQTMDVWALTDAEFDKDTITYNNAPANNTGTNSIIASQAFGGDKLGTVSAGTAGAKTIDVTDYVKSLPQNSKAVFAFTTEDAPLEVVFDRDFEDGSEIRVPRDIRYGGQDSVVAEVVTEEGNSFLALSNLRYSYSRTRFVNSLGKLFLTDSDIGTKYRVSFSVKPESDTKILSGFMSTIPDAAYTSGSSAATNLERSGGYINYQNAPAGVWTDFEFEYTVNNETVAGLVNALSIEQSEIPGGTANQAASAVLCIDNIRVEKIPGASEVALAKAVSLNLAYNVADDTPNAAKITSIQSSGNFLSGDSVLVNADTSCAFNKSVEDVKFYVNGNPVPGPYGNKGSAYSLRLINLAAGQYEVYAEVTFSDGETVTTDAQSFTISSGTSYDVSKAVKRGTFASESGFSVTKTVKSNLQEDVSGILILAIYDGSGELTAVLKTEPQTIGAGSIKEFVISTEALPAITDASYAKLMLWSDLESMLPLSATETIQ